MKSWEIDRGIAYNLGDGRIEMRGNAEGDIVCEMNRHGEIASQELGFETCFYVFTVTTMREGGEKFPPDLILLQIIKSEVYMEEYN